MITQCNTKLFFQFQILKFFVGKYCSEWKVIHCYCPESLSSPACAVSVASLHPPSAASPRLLSSLRRLISAPAIIEVKLVFIGVNGAVIDGSPAVSKGQLEICHLTQPDICPSTRNWNLNLHHIISVRSFVRWCKVQLFTVSSITSLKKEKSPVKTMSQFLVNWIKYKVTRQSFVGMFEGRCKGDKDLEVCFFQTGLCAFHGGQNESSHPFSDSEFKVQWILAPHLYKLFGVERILFFIVGF